MDDKNQITFQDFELTISAVVRSSWPPATFETHPDEPVAINDALAHALHSCGLEARLDDVTVALREFVRPSFEKTVAEFEAMRRSALGGDA